jgi:hypothetical protein
MSENSKVVTSPLWRFRKEWCSKCPYKDACSSDKSIEFRCIEALIALSLSRLTEKTVLANAHL